MTVEAKIKKIKERGYKIVSRKYKEITVQKGNETIKGSVAYVHRQLYGY